MDSGRFVLAVVLMIAVVVLTNVLFPPVPRKQNANKPVASQSAAANSAAAPQAPPSGQPTIGPTQIVPSGRADTIVIESPLFRYGVSTTGASLVSAEMLSWQSFTRKGPVQLAPKWPRGLMAYRVQVGNQQIDLSSLPFTSSTRHVKLEKGGAPQTVRFTHSGTAAGTIEVDYTFSPDSYLADVTVAVRGMAQPASRLLIDFGPRLAINEANKVEDERAFAYVVNAQKEGIHSVPLRGVKQERIDEGPLDWVAIKNKYFVAAAIRSDKKNGKPFGGVLAEPSTE
ncbi:MAG TPA: membrane protein insertase YidC, partial [Longimicrobiales bacterium]|nr:membrane protein insertase YidC [Longimicrobiales bacterium]